MVVSKRCKVCTIIDTDNVPISGEYFGKLIPITIKKICGIELDPKKTNGVLICQACILQILHTGVFVEKLQNAVSRLKKNEKESKPKTPSKNSSTAQLRIVDAKNSITDNEAKQNVSTTESDTHNAESAKTKTENTPTIKKRIARTKSVNFDKPLLNDDTSITENGGMLNAVNNMKFKKFLDHSIHADIPSATSLKRKSTSTDEGVNNATASDETPMKQQKVDSVDGDVKKDLSVDEHGEKDIVAKTRNCILCGKEFHSKKDLRIHIEEAHMGERLKACPQCSSEFRSKQKYESHVFGEKCNNTVHACQYPKCAKRFKTVHKMELHMQEKHASQDEFDCE